MSKATSCRYTHALTDQHYLTLNRVGLPKKTQTYFFFQIDDSQVHGFRVQLGKLLPHITTTAQVTEDMKKIAVHKKKAADERSIPTLIEVSGVNIVFSHKGLSKIGITDEIGDSAFDNGMLADAKNLGDKGTTSANKFTPDWVPAFKGDIHGMILVSGDSHATVAKKLLEVESIFHVGTHQATIHEVLRIVGDVRPGKEAGHEHFGFNDGISQPAIEGVDTKPNPGQESVRQGIILLGRDGDAPTINNSPVTRPSWALDGSFLAFRYLFQLVPEFDRFLKEHPITATGLSPAEGSELLGARLVGRWKSGKSSKVHHIVIKICEILYLNQPDDHVTMYYFKHHHAAVAYQRSFCLVHRNMMILLQRNFDKVAILSLRILGDVCL